MTSACRIVSGVVLLLAVIGLPIADAACELVCPQASPVQVAAVARPVVGAPASPSCHETGGSAAHAASGQPISGSAAPGQPGPDAAAAPASSRAHGCDHPAVVTAQRSEGSLWVSQPTWHAAVAPTSTSPLARISRAFSAAGQARAPASPPVAFSLVLRI